MSRRTDAERGARMARDFAFPTCNQIPLFPGDHRLEQERSMWASILDSAELQLEESRWAREATHGR